MKHGAIADDVTINFFLLTRLLMSSATVSTFLIFFKKWRKSVANFWPSCDSWVFMSHGDNGFVDFLLVNMFGVKSF